MPEEVQLPGAHVRAGVEKVDVMSFLGVKRAASLDSSERDEAAP